MSNQKEMMIVTIKLKAEVDLLKYLKYLLIGKKYCAILNLIRKVDQLFWKFTLSIV